ncbi:MAG: peptidase S24, partial [Nitrososphaerales archaeon]
MQLYSGPLPGFVGETTRKEIAMTLARAFTSWFGRPPGGGEVRSWNNSLVRLKDVLVGASLEETGVILEYQLPLSSRRLDCMVTGKDLHGSDRAEIIELKQWESCKATEEENLVLSYVGHAERPVLHPCVQVAGYETYLKDYHSTFSEENAVGLGSCAYLHNYRAKADDPLLAEKFTAVIQAHPLFVANDFDRITRHLASKVGKGEGLQVLHRIEAGKTGPSKQLMKHVAEIIRGNPAYVLMDDQLVVYETVLRLARMAGPATPKRCIVVRGGPGTGKS